MTPLLLKERRLLRRSAAAGHVTILNFHEVRPSRGTYDGQLAPTQFDELIGFVARTYDVRTFAELREGIRGDRPVAVISFDDGFKSFVEHAMPILSRHRVRANQNVIPSAVLGRRPFTVELADLLAATPDALLRTLRVPGSAARFRPGDADARMRFAVAVSNHLKLRPRAEREPMWQAVRDQLRDVDVRPTEMMDLADVREAARTHEIGAHSYEHETMTFELADYFESDFLRCRDFFATELGRTIDVYAFPNGLARAEQVAWLEAQGVRDVLLTGDRWSTRGASMHQRFNIGAPTMRELRLQALGARAAPLL